MVNCGEMNKFLGNSDWYSDTPILSRSEEIPELRKAKINFKAGSSQL